MAIPAKFLSLRGGCARRFSVGKRSWAEPRPPHAARAAWPARGPAGGTSP